LAALVVLIALTGCGGGGSSSAPTPTPVPPPTAVCNATAITPYTSVSATRTQTAGVAATTGTQVTLSPEPTSGGTWSWSGCGTSGSAREQTFTPTATCTATVVHTNSCGTTSSQAFTVTFTPVQVGPYPNYNTSPAAPDSSGMPSTATQLATQFTLGWNIGNTMEAIGGETAWGNPLISNELMALVRANGVTAVRLPVSWNQYADQATAAISPTWLARVRQVVQYAVDNGLYIVVNVHWDQGWLESHVNTADQVAVNHRQRAYWQQIATTLRDFDEHVMFASANEPVAENAEQMAVLLSYHQTFVDAVRETGGRNAYRVLVVQGPRTDIELSNSLWGAMPADTVANRQMVEVHYYDPFNFTLMSQDEVWGNQHYYWGAPNQSTTDTTRNSTWGDEAHVDTKFGLMKTKFVDQGIPVILGEFAAMRRDSLTGADRDLHLQSRRYYHQYVVRSAVTNGLRPFFWDVGAFAGGVFDRANNTVADPAMLTALQQGAAGAAP
jgi:aryl-phospho-beta-D-glucosidase BglC (GH1 family)